MIEQFTHFKNSWWWGSRGKHISIISCASTALSVGVLLLWAAPDGEDSSRPRPGLGSRFQRGMNVTGLNWESTKAFGADPRQPRHWATVPPGLPPASLAASIPLGCPQWHLAPVKRISHLLFCSESTLSYLGNFLPRSVLENCHHLWPLCVRRGLPQVQVTEVGTRSPETPAGKWGPDTGEGSGPVQVVIDAVTTVGAWRSVLRSSSGIWCNTGPARRRKTFSKEMRALGLGIGAEVQ